MCVTLIARSQVEELPLNPRFEWLSGSTGTAIRFAVGVSVIAADCCRVM